MLLLAVWLNGKAEVNQALSASRSGMASVYNFCPFRISYLFSSGFCLIVEAYCNCWRDFHVLVPFSYKLRFQGDFLVHFTDIAREELMKKPDEISVAKLQVCRYNICKEKLSFHWNTTKIVAPGTSYIQFFFFYIVPPGPCFAIHSSCGRSISWGLNMLCG